MRFILLIGSILLLFQNNLPLKAQASNTITIGLQQRHSQIQGVILTQPSDFTATLESALASIPNGGVINLLDGNFPLENTIKLKSNQSIIGLGPSTNLTITENINVVRILANNNFKAENISIQNLKISINNTRFNEDIFYLKSGNGNVTHLQNNRIANIVIDYENSVEAVNIIRLLCNKRAFIRDNTITDIEVIFAQTNALSMVDILANGKIKDNDFNNINIVKIAQLNEMTPGIGLQLETGREEAFLLNNTFSNLKFPPIEKGMYFSIGSNQSTVAAEESWMNNNRFTDISFEGFKIGISFNKMDNINVYDFSRNMFRDIILQSKEYSEIGIDNVFGKGNTFLHCHVYDWLRKNANAAQHIISVSEDANYTFVHSSRIFLDHVIDHGENTSWICNGTNYNTQQNSCLNKTSQLLLYDNADKSSPIKANRHTAKITSLKNASGNTLNFHTLDNDATFSKKLFIAENGNTVVKKQLQIDQLPNINDGQILMAKANKVGTIKTNQLKNNLGITSLENQIDLLDFKQQKEYEKLEERLAILETYIHQLEQQLNEQ